MSSVLIELQAVWAPELVYTPWKIQVDILLATASDIQPAA
jgi:hypothetical protein